MKTDATRRTPATVRAMIKTLCDMRGFSEETTERILNDPEVYERIQMQMQAAQLEVREGTHGKYFHIETATIYGAYTWESMYLSKAA